MGKIINTLLLIIALSCTGCFQLEHSVSYRDRKTILVYDIVNIAGGACEYWDATKVFTAEFHDGWKRLARTSGLADKFSSFGYGLIYSRRVNVPGLSSAEVLELQKGVVPSRIVNDVYDYSIICIMKSSIDILVIKKAEINAYVVDNRDSRVIWRSSDSGAVRTPFSGLIPFGLHYDPTFIAALTEAIEEAFNDCPLIQSK